MLFFSVQSGVGDFKTYTCDYDLSSVTEIILEKQFSNPSTFVRSENGWATSVIWDAGVVSIKYDGGVKDSPVFEDILGFPIDMNEGDNWALPVVMDSSAQLVYLNKDAEVIGSSNMSGFEYAAGKKGVGIVFYNYRNRKAMLASVSGTQQQLVLPAKPKYQTGMTLIPGSKLLYFSDANELVCAKLDDSGLVEVFKVPIWESVGGEEKVPTGSPVYGMDCNIYVVTKDSKILKLDPEGMPIKNLSMVGVKQLSEYTRVSRVFDLSCGAEVDLGDIPVLINKRVYEFEITAGEFGEDLVQLTAGDFMALSLDKVVWATEAEIENIPAGESRTIYFVLYPPNETVDGVSELTLVTPYSDEPIEVEIKYNSVRPKSIVVPTKAVKGSLTGSVEGNALVALDEEGSTAERIKYKASFPG
jgi:hypothetical protein